MGWFSFGKKKTVSDPMTDWLNEVDKAYARAFQVKNAAGLEKYMTRGCIVRQREKIRLGEQAYSGLQRYQHTEWVKGSSADGELLYIKNVTYDQIKMSQGIVASVGDEYTEHWIVIKESDKYLISEIRRVA